MSDLAAVVSLSVTFILIVVGIVLVVWIALLAIRGPDHPLKRLRYEAGNPPKGTPRTAVPPQYYGFILIFLVVDTVFALLFLLSLVSKTVLGAPYTTAWLLTIIVLVVPPLLYALKYAKNIREWA